MFQETVVDLPITRPPSQANFSSTKNRYTLTPLRLSTYVTEEGRNLSKVPSPEQ